MKTHDRLCQGPRPPRVRYRPSSPRVCTRTSTRPKACRRSSPVQLDQDGVDAPPRKRAPLRHSFLRGRSPLLVAGAPEQERTEVVRPCSEGQGHAEAGAAAAAAETAQEGALGPGTLRFLGSEVLERRDGFLLKANAVLGAGARLSRRTRLLDQRHRSCCRRSRKLRFR